MGDNPSKDGLIPHVVCSLNAIVLKLVKALREGLAAYQLVGEVTAHQG